MRTVILAYPFKGRQPDQPIELEDDDARRLVRHGRARWPEPDVTHVDEEPDFGDAQAEALGALDDGASDDDPSPYAGTDSDDASDDEPQA